MKHTNSIFRFASLALGSALPLFGTTGPTVAAPNSPKAAELLQAAKDDDRSAVRKLIAQHVDVTAAQGDGFTALHWAAYNDDVELAKALLAAGAAPEPRTRLEGDTPLFLAAVNGDPALLDVLLAGGAKVATANDNGTTPLMEAAAAGVPAAILDLLDHGADINAREKTYGQTALFFAASHNRPNAIRLLTRHGADTTVKTTVQKLERITVNADGEEVPAAGAKRGGADGAKEAAPKEAEADAKTPAGAKKDEADAYGLTRADRAARVYGSLAMGGLTALHVAARDGQIDAARALIEAHADINAQTETDKSTPLLLALINGHYDLAEFLLAHSADAKLASTDGVGPLYAAIDVQWAPHTWYPQPVVSQEKTPYLQLLQDLIAHGADVNAKLERKLWFRVFANDETWVDVTGATPFWRAAYAGDLDAMKLLAAHGADVNVASKSNDTPLMVAAGLGWAAYWTSNAPSSRLDAVKFCLEHGADINNRDTKGYSAIHGAAFRGDNTMIEYMLTRGADLNVVSKTGDTVADSANGLFEHATVHPDTVALLEKLGSKSSNNCRSNECVVPPKPDKPVVAAKTDEKPGAKPDASSHAAAVVAEKK